MEHIEGKKWKYWDRATNTYGYKTFDHVKELDSCWEYDFFYKENYYFSYSPKNCCYQMWDCVIEPGSVVVDLGANIGLFTHGASRIAKKVISIEGSPEHYSCLVENNSDRDNVYFCNSIVTGEIPADTYIPSGRVWTDRKNPIEFTIKKIMEIYQLEKIDFLKIDIEGFEYDVFDSLSPSILSRIDKIACETHDPDDRKKNLQLHGKIRSTFSVIDFCGNVTDFYYFTTPK
jgi:FkbM family methyltransferase